MAEADVPAQHRCAAHMHFPGFEHNCLVQRQIAEFVVLAEEDTQQDCVAGNLHVRSISSR